MIHQLSTKYNKATAAFFFVVFYCSTILPSYANKPVYNQVVTVYNGNYNNSSKNIYQLPINNTIATTTSTNYERQKINNNDKVITANNKYVQIPEPSIGGPSQPEMSSFKSVGTDNMVNLFTGDFSYNIPLLDVGGYPVNIYYDGGVSMDQDASWVGLGWNINPGNVNRNMRGVPDDFNGTDIIKQRQEMKPNINWGVNLGADLEVVGIKNFKAFSGSIGATLGVSFNNYLGPALDLGIKGSTGIKVAQNVFGEKSALTLGGGLNITASSRSGVTFAPSLSLTAKQQKTAKVSSIGFGVSASTSYNSRNGIKGIQISEQVSFNRGNAKDDNVGANGSMTASSQSITFNKPSYVPTMRMPMTNSAFSGHFQLGGALFGVYPSFEIEVYKQKSEVASEDVNLLKPIVGYLYMQNAANNANAVMDFTRFNDNEVTPTTPIISVPQYSYDVFSIQGEGTGGSVRAYRNDQSFVKDNTTASKDKNISLGADVGIPGHFGANFNTIKTPSTIGSWDEGNKLKSIPGFVEANGSFENVYFRNPGENSVINPSQYDKIGGADLVRHKIGGTNLNSTLETTLEKINKAGYNNGEVNTATVPAMQERKKRTQLISFLNAEDATKVGLEKVIKSYDINTVLDVQNNLNFTVEPRFDGTIRKKHHISQINVTEANGQRYVYGIPVYNLVQKDFTFSVNNTESTTEPDKVAIGANEPTTLNNGVKDGYISITETPSYAHSFLLTGLLSPDYVDVAGDGITDDDLGGAVKFNYSKINGVSKWRTPLNANTANFSGGKRTEAKDDKGIISYGERESWYVHSIESKTMIALFKLENRNDSKGAQSDIGGGANSFDNTARCLKQISLYSKADLKKNGINAAKPIKTVHFEYSYNLCKNTPNNTTNGQGKLTLEKIYFTFNGKNRASKNQYVFSYGTTQAENPDYQFNASDRWGTYKPSSLNPTSTPLLKNSEYPYGLQDVNQKTTIDQNAGAWMLKKILLPSGGQMEVNYESDDYAFVQNKRAAIMMPVVGFGNTSSNMSNQLYDINGTGFTENVYAFIKIPEPCTNMQDVYTKYLEGMEQLSFKLAVNMPKGMEFVNSYATVDGTNYGLYNGDNTNKTIWVKLNKVDNLSPLSLTAVEFLREQLPGQAFAGYDVSESAGLQQVADMLTGLFDGLKNAFKEPVKTIRLAGKAQTVDLTRCFVRLNDPDGIKYGGGYRVKSIRLKDNWKQMNQGQLYTSEYGQEYDYTTKEMFNGNERTISSGVASYEPSLGGDENPFQQMIQVANTVPLGPTSYGAVELPVLDAFFPSALVGYSKVTVRSLKKGVQNPAKKSRSGIGKQVSEYYTAKDFPTYTSNTTFDPATDKVGKTSTFAFFYKFSKDTRTLSQGFLVETNDMHGKLKSQASYPENDEKTPLNYTQNFYRNTGILGFDEKFDFINAAQSGTIEAGNMGIDVELYTDTREFAVKSKSLEIQGQLDLFPVILPFWLPFIWPVVGKSENIYRAVTTTKVVNYHSVLDSVLVIDKGSVVSTKNLVFDAETGDVIINRTNNEYKQPIYNTTYPAWWAYSGMGPAYKNTDAIYTANFKDGVIDMPTNIFESGDELYLLNQGTPSTDACAAYFNGNVADLLWAFDKNKNNSSLTNTTPSFLFMDKEGNLYSKNNVRFRIIRSGKRNMLDAKVASAVTMASPIVEISPGVRKLLIDQTTKTINASSLEYKEKWQTDGDVFKRYISVQNPANCTIVDSLACNGFLEKKINPYRKGLLGTFRTHLSKVFYGSRGNSTENNLNVTPINTNLPVNGYLNNFKLYWDFNNQHYLVPDVASTQWVWNSQITKVNAKGLELETKDALGIYTAAQYGYNKTMPVAIANNSRSNEMFAENFEDFNYNESITQGTVIDACKKRHFDFSNAAVSTANATNNAHSGNTMMVLEGNSTYSKAIPLANAISDNYNLSFNKDTAKITVNNGANLIGQSFYPYVNYSNPQNQATIQNLTCGISYEITDTATVNTATWDITHNFGNDFEYYFSTNSSGIVSVNLSITYNVGTSPYITFVDRSASISISIFDLNNNYVTSLSLYCNDNGCSYINPTICLPVGTYKAVGSIYGSYFGSSYHWPGQPPMLNHYYGFNIGLGQGCYRNLSFANGCIYNLPIPATEDMLNNSFAIAPNKKYLFSAWVKENCAIPCTTQTYTNSKVEIDFGGAAAMVSLLPTGTIIEGWQKVEGEFTAPVGATTVQMRLRNNSGATNYWDDIRIHPYNANVKSYVYDPINLRLVAELDANNNAAFYKYDAEGTLIRTKVETKEGIKTIKETRSAKQKTITTLQ